MATRRLPDHLFKPGQSGNPGGRPKGEARVREAAQKHGLEALAVLVDAMKDPDARVRIRAAEIVLERGFGKAPQAIIGGEPGDRPLAFVFSWKSA
jgi:HEAT repeat protein